VKVHELIERLIGFPPDATVMIDQNTGVITEIMLVVHSQLLIDGENPVLIVSPEPEYDEEPDYDDDFPMALEYSSPGEDARNDEVAREEAAMEREYFGE
jgi:hypothetical protein